MKLFFSLLIHHVAVLQLPELQMEKKSVIRLCPPCHKEMQFRQAVISAMLHKSVISYFPRHFEVSLARSESQDKSDI